MAGSHFGQSLTLVHLCLSRSASRCEHFANIFQCSTILSTILEAQANIYFWKFLNWMEGHPGPNIKQGNVLTSIRFLEAGCWSTYPFSIFVHFQFDRRLFIALKICFHKHFNCIVCRRIEMLTYRFVTFPIFPQISKLAKSPSDFSSFHREI